jgi:hypothetical protein
VLDEFYRVAFRKKIYRTIDELPSDLDGWVMAYNETRSHQGRWCYGKTPMQSSDKACANWSRRSSALSDRRCVVNADAHPLPFGA